MGEASARELELELKLRVGATFAVPDVGGIAGAATATPAVRQQLTADYFDADDLRLARDGITLRRRAGGTDDGWHLKLPLGNDAKDGTLARHELQLPLLATDTVPARFRELLTARLRGTDCRCVATLETDRSVQRLLASDGAELAELTDDRVTVRDRGGVVVQFRELEVEDRGGGRPLLAALRAALIAAGAVPGKPTAKLVYALGPAAQAPPDVPPPEPVRRRDPAARLVLATLRRHVRALLAYDVAVRRHQPDSIHQLRVTCRRLRSDLRTFRPLLDRGQADLLRAELQWFSAVLGGARDAEVLAERLVGLVATLPEDAARSATERFVRSEMTGRMAAAETAVAEALTGDRYLALVQALVEAAANPHTTDAAVVPCRVALPPLVSAAWRRLDRAAALALPPGAANADLHLARIEAKRARYATEAVVAVYGKPARRLAGYAEKVQTRLGEQHDAIVAAEVIRDLAAAPRVGRAAFGLGVLYQQELTAASSDRAAFRSLWPQDGWRKQRSWLNG
ncbi:MAG: CYTH and CHAD domain-containing protein [Mycobacteriales bacterium]